VSSAEARAGHGTTRLAIVDDHALARDGLQDMLADEPDIEVVGEAADGREAVLLCSRLRPDLVLMDVRMPDMDGLTATREIKRRHPRTSVLMITMHENPDYLLEALKAGASGYVLKDAPQHEIIAAVREVRSGESPLDQRLAARLLKRLSTALGEESRSLPGGSQGIANPLSSRELEVLGLVRLGRTNRQIASDLTISIGTVKRHIENITTKLEVSDRTQAVVKALELGILELSR
jgi:two-component system, NarL family, response regulator DegU